MAERKRKLDTGRTSNWDKPADPDAVAKAAKFNPYLSDASGGGGGGGGGGASYYGGGAASGMDSKATPAQMRAKEPNTNPLTGRPFTPNYRKLLVTRQKLPVYQFLDDLLTQVSGSQSVVVEGETGSGKTTQIPQFLVDAGYAKFRDGRQRMVACTQPRRVAAMSIAKRVRESEGQG